LRCSIIGAYPTVADATLPGRKGALMKAESLIPASWFYRDDNQKTMFNWFLYELALKLFDHVQSSKLKPLVRWKSRLNDKQVAQFCAYYAKRMRVSVLENTEGGSGIIALYNTYLLDYCHDNTLSEDDALGKVVAAAWGALLKSCSVCPCRCAVRRDEHCELFDRMERGGYLS